MRDKLKIFLAKVRLDDPAAVQSVLSIHDSHNLARMLGKRRSGFSYAYEDETCVGRFVASNGRTALSFSVTGLTRQEAASIAVECEQIVLWDIYEFRKAADRALGASFDRVQRSTSWLSSNCGWGTTPGRNNS
jgi:hypothetical protein